MLRDLPGTRDLVGRHPQAPNGSRRRAVGCAMLICHDRRCRQAGQARQEPARAVHPGTGTNLRLRRRPDPPTAAGRALAGLPRIGTRVARSRADAAAHGPGRVARGTGRGSRRAIGCAPARDPGRRSAPMAGAADLRTSPDTVGRHPSRSCVTVRPGSPRRHGGSRWTTWPAGYGRRPAGMASGAWSASSSWPAQEPVRLPSGWRSTCSALRFTWRDLTVRPEYVVATVRRVLGDRRGARAA
jgi:hypothetical protein